MHLRERKLYSEVESLPPQTAIGWKARLSTIAISSPACIGESIEGQIEGQDQFAKDLIQILKVNRQYLTLCL